MKKKPYILQENKCDSCKCICSADCMGDTKFCTADKPLEIKCNHECECYLSNVVNEEKFKIYARIAKDASKKPHHV